MKTTVEPKATKTTSKTGKELSFKVKSPENFISFLKKFKAIEKGLLLDITPDNLRAESHSPDRGIVKSSSIALDSVLEGKVPVDLIKVGIFNISKVIDLFKHFEASEELYLQLTFEEIGGENVGTSLKFVSPNLKFKIKCAGLDLFTYVSPAQFENIVKNISDTKGMEFSFPKESFNKLNSLCSFDSGEERLQVSIRNGEINFIGESFDYLLGATTETKSFDFSFYKNRFTSVDEENSNFLIGTDKLLINSVETNTQVIIGRVQ